MGPTSEQDPVAGRPSAVREDGIQHRRRGDPFVRECDQHDRPRPIWDSKGKAKGTSTRDEEKKAGTSVLGVLKSFVKTEKKTSVKVDDVLSDP